MSSNDVELLGWVISIVGVLIFIVGSIQFLRAAYEVGFWWLICVIFVPLAEIFFLIFHFSEAWPSTKRCLFGILVVVGGTFLHW